ncbi:MAG: methyltransferase domain-containing protein [Candidatus Micrarchaeia archaeon]|jgi:SAM-dependent methyltransferase
MAQRILSAAEERAAKTRESAAELARRNRTEHPEMEIVYRRPFASKLFAERETNTPRHRTAEAMNYKNYGNSNGALVPSACLELERRAKGQETVHFLDLGPGHGDGLKVAEGVGRNVFAHGLGLNYPSDDSYVPRGRWIRRHFESTVIRKKGKKEGFFDVIQSRFGLQHATNKAVALENVLNSLKVGGVFFHHHPNRNFTAKELTDLLESQGFEVRLGGGFNQVQAITRKSMAQADLRRLYQHCGLNEVPMRKDLP